jgi:hypothetical protein
LLKLVITSHNALKLVKISIRLRICSILICELRMMKNYSVRNPTKRQKHSLGGEEGVGGRQDVWIVTIVIFLDCR